jgi:biotin carboxyl carrier protein
MTEAEWLACTNPNTMVEFLRGKVSDRKLRLFGCASARSVQANLEHEVSRKGIEVLERFADARSTVNEYEVMAVVVKSVQVGTYYSRPHPEAPPFVMVGSLVTPSTVVAIIEEMKIFNEIVSVCFGVISEVLVNNEDIVEYGTPLFRIIPTVAIPDWGRTPHHQVPLVHDIFGNPFRSPVIDDAWLSQTVTSFVQVVYEAHDFNTMPILADALEEAGCTDAAILGHLRGPGPHVRGCWVLDLLLGKS